MADVHWWTLGGRRVSVPMGGYHRPEDKPGTGGAHAYLASGFVLSRVTDGAHEARVPSACICLGQGSEVQPGCCGCHVCLQPLCKLQSEEELMM